MRIPHSILFLWLYIEILFFKIIINMCKHMIQYVYWICIQFEIKIHRKNIVISYQFHVESYQFHVESLPNRYTVLTGRISPLHWTAPCCLISGTEDPGLNSTGPESASIDSCCLLPSSDSLDTESTSKLSSHHLASGKFYEIQW